jgi:hypothetical protein
MKKEYHVEFLKYWNKNGWTGNACIIIRNLDGAIARFNIDSDSNIIGLFCKKFNGFGHIAYTEVWLKNREFNKLTKNYEYINDCDYTEFWNKLEKEFNKNPDCYTE